jgi:hypothetical protein
MSVTEIQERFYTVQEVAKLWRVSRNVVLAEFRHRPGVFRAGHGNSRPRLRIPASLLHKVMRERGYIFHEENEEREDNGPPDAA